MDVLRTKAVAFMRSARDELLMIPSDELSGQRMLAWYQQWKSRFDQAESLTGSLPIDVNIRMKMQGYWNETDSDLAAECRLRLVEFMDQVIREVDSVQVV